MGDGRDDRDGRNDGDGGNDGDHGDDGSDRGDRDDGDGGDDGDNRDRRDAGDDGDGWDDRDDRDGGNDGDEGDDRSDGDDHDGGDQIAFQRGPQPSLPPKSAILYYALLVGPGLSSGGPGYALGVADPARHSVNRSRSRPVLGSIERGDQVRPGIVDPRTADPCYWARNDRRNPRELASHLPRSSEG